MKQKSRFLVLAIFLLAAAFESQAQINKKDMEYNITTFTEEGVRAPKENFTGTVWVNMNVKPDEGYNTNIGTVTFEPNARTNWHKHASGQILFVIDGIGYYQEKGKPVQLIKKGDVVKIPKNVVHWHGGSKENEMRHIALVPEYDKDKTEWLEPVSDADFNSYKSEK